jgi:hypothetical protein
MASAAERQAANITGPVAGQISCLTTSTSATSIDLSSIGPTVGSMANAAALPQVGYPGLTGCVGRFVEFFSDGADTGLLFGTSNASVTGNNAPNLSVTGSNTVGSNGSCCVRIPAGTYRTYVISSATRWLGYVASATGNLRVSVTSLPE